MEKRLLITGFDPFGGQTVNPAREVLRGLPDRIGDFVLCKLEVPTVFGLAGKTVLDAAAHWQPDVILCLGVAAGRKDVTPERIAVNIQDATLADNAGNQPRGTRIVPNGAAAYFTTVPVEAMTQRILEAGLPASVSNSAGTFVCNDLLYTLLHHFQNTQTAVGFIHVPALPGQHEHCLPLTDTIRAVTAAISACNIQP